jgi:hypothetical protein
MVFVVAVPVLAGIIGALVRGATAVMLSLVLTRYGSDRAVVPAANACRIYHG